MKNLSNKILYNWIYIMVIMVISFFLVGLYILSSGANLTEEATEAFRTYNLNDKKSQLQTEVHNRLDEIEYERKNLLADEQVILKNKIQQVSTLLLSAEIIGIEDPDQRRLAAIQTYEQIVLDDQDYLYFVMSTDGALLRSGTDAELVGVDLYDSVDVEGNYFIQEIIQAENVPEGLYVDYYWPKVKDGPPLKKTSYCYYLAEFDFIIGTGIYHQDLQTQLKDRIYSRLQSYYENKESYIFVTEYDSTARVSGDPALIGMKMSGATSFDGQSIHNMFMDVIAIESSGFSTYQFMRKNDTVLSEKLSYIHVLEGWDAYIGIGFYVDDLNAEVDNFSLLFKKHYYNQALYIIIGLLLIAIIVFAVFQRGAYLQKMYLKKEDMIFENLFDLSSEAIIVIATNGDLLYANNNADNLFHHNLDDFLGAEGLNLEHVAEHIYTIKTPSDRVYFVSIKKEFISFKNQSSIIHFISDITAQYLESNSFERMAYTDDLTGLPNRRALINTYEDLCFDLNEDESIVLGMIDIDNFKHVNDTHGHIVGDQTLKILSDIFSFRLRHHDFFFRYGGEEFIVLLKNISLSKAQLLLEELNELFDTRNDDELGFNCTYSCGLVMIDKSNKDLDLEQQVKKADALLYKAKELGRNRIEI